MTNSGYGFDFYLQAFNFRKPGEQKTGTIKKLFGGDVFVWAPHGTGIAPIQNGAVRGSLLVDSIAKTITLSANIPNLTSDSIPYFYSYGEGPSPLILDELCIR
jgi:hypothetical protein